MTPLRQKMIRFLQHVLPDRFLRIRHYGLLGNRLNQRYLTRCRQLLGTRPPATADERSYMAADWMRVLLGIDLTRCPCCGEKLRHEVLRPSHGMPARTPLPRHQKEPSPWDTS